MMVGQDLSEGFYHEDAQEPASDETRLVVDVEGVGELAAVAIALGPKWHEAAPLVVLLGLAWGKLLINVNNAVNALSGRTLIEELKQRDYRRVFAGSMPLAITLLMSAEYSVEMSASSKCLNILNSSTSS